MTKPQLSKEKIIDVAMEIANREGHEAVSLRGVAKELKVHVTSLYNHVPTKDAVFTEMMKKMVEESEFPIGPFTWQVWVKRYAEATRAMARKHPGAFQLFQRGLAQGKKTMDTFESAIAAFRSDGFDAKSAYCAVKATNVAAFGLALDDLARYNKPTVPIDPAEIPIEQFPHIHEVVAIAEETDTFVFLVEALIEGIEATRSSVAEAAD